MDTACCRCLHWPCTGVAKEEQGAFFVCLSVCLPVCLSLALWQAERFQFCLLMFVASANVVRKVMFFDTVCLCVCLSNSKITANFSELDVMVGPVSGKSWVTDVGGDLVPDMDSGSLFHFPYHCGMVDLMRFISISHTVTFWFLWQCAKWLTPARN